MITDRTMIVLRTMVVALALVVGTARAEPEISIRVGVLEAGVGEGAAAIGVGLSLPLDRTFALSGELSTSIGDADFASGASESGVEGAYGFELRYRAVGVGWTHTAFGPDGIDAISFSYTF